MEISDLKYLVLLFSLLLLIEELSGSENDLFIDVDLSRIIHEVDPKFLSVALGSSIIAKKWSTFDFKNLGLINLAKGLSPSYLRLGGTSADLVVFTEKPVNPLIESNEIDYDYYNYSEDYLVNDYDFDDIHDDLQKHHHHNNKTIYMSGIDWMLINEFCYHVNFQFLFDINVLLRNSFNDTWNETNFKTLLDFSSKIRFPNISWELGNEPNHLGNSLGHKLSAEKLGKDFKSLRRILNSYPLYANSTLVGPDVNGITRCANDYEKCKAFKYLSEVLESAGPGIFDAVTTHQYYLNGRNSTIRDFTSPQVLDIIDRDINATVQHMKKMKESNYALWLGETASAYGGGAPNLSNRYPDGFLWLNKLGVAAKYGYKVVIRQTFYGGNYALIDRNLRPNTDYWISYIYKKLVGTRVLDLKMTNDDKYVRLFAHCAKSDRNSVVIFGLNISPKTKIIPLSESLTKRSSLKSEKYIIESAEPDKLNTNKLKLNGEILDLIDDKELPQLNPQLLIDNYLTLPPYGIGFWTLHFHTPIICN